MEIQPKVLLALLALCLCLGAAVGVLCDVFRLFCEQLKKKGLRGCDALRALGDFSSVMLGALGVIVLCYYFNRGTVRGFCYIGLAAGFFVYKHTLSVLICALLKAATRILFIVFRIIFTPFGKFFSFIIKKLNKIRFYLAKVLAKLLIWVYNGYNYKYILKKAKKGFLVFSRKDGQK
jgi:hypothetical protein